jgi:hypothetical protein
MKLGKIRLVRIGIEASGKGVVSSAITTECLCYDPEVKRDDNYIAREAAFGLAGTMKGCRGPSTGKITIKRHLTGNGSTGLSAADTVLLQACGMLLSTLTFTPETHIADQKTITIDCWRDGHKERLTGCMGTWTMTFPRGMPVMMTYELSGKYEDLGDEDTPTATVDKTLPFKGASATFTIDGKGIGISECSLAANNPVQMREDIAAAGGFAYFFIGAGRNYKAIADPEVEPSGTWDPSAISEAGTEAALSIIVKDATTKLTIAAAACEILPTNVGVRGETLVWDGLTIQINATTVDAELSMVSAAV